MSKEEVLSLSSSDSFQIHSNLLFLDQLVDYSRLAYTKKVYELLFTSTHSSLEEDMKKFDFNPFFDRSFKLNTVNNQDFDTSLLADIIWKDLDSPKADMQNPVSTFEILFCKKVFVCKLIFEQKDDFENRRSHSRPFNHPTGLHPRLARFMINLSNSNYILDPFCGAGGILIEAGLINIDFKGFDLDPLMVKRCSANLTHYGIKPKVEVADALNFSGKVECVVTDLPYGRNSKSKDLQYLYSSFFKKYYEIAEIMVVALPDFIDIKELIGFWKVRKLFNYYLHKSLSKKIFLLTKD